jgi:hypothetical protein
VGLDDCFEVSTCCEENLREYYVAVIHINCYKLYIQSHIHISLLIISADIYSQLGYSEGRMSPLIICCVACSSRFSNGYVTAVY